MDITFNCEKCGQQIVVAEARAEWETECPHCHSVVRPPRTRIPVKRQCPNCDARLAADAVVCVLCGWDSRTNETVETDLAATTTRDWKRAGLWALGGFALIALLVGLALARGRSRHEIAHAPVATNTTPSPAIISKPTWRVLDWQVSATPTFAGRGATASAAGPIIGITVAIESNLDKQAPEMWPGAAAAELLRAAASQGPYQVIVTLGPAEMRQPHLTTSGSRQLRGHFQYQLADPTPTPGHRYFYKLRFLDAAKETLAESGYCSTVALALPSVTQQVDARGFPVLSWEADALDKSAFAGEPRVVIGLWQLHDLARLPVITGRFQLPLKVTSPLGRPMEVQFGVEALARVDTWGQTAGQCQSTARLAVHRKVELPTPAAPPQSATVEYRRLVRAQVPTGLMAAASSGSVKLTWPAFTWSTNDWVEGPSVVLHRWEETSAATTRRVREQEVFRGNGAATQFTDTAVQNGSVYLYALGIEGVTRATSWCPDVGEYECFLPVNLRGDELPTPNRVVAAPDKLRPVRVALVMDATSDPRVNAAQAHCLRVLRLTPWVEVVEHSLGAAHPAADVILECRTRFVGQRPWFDVWLDDFQESHRERVLSVPLDTLDPEETAARILQQCGARFPQQMVAFPATSTRSCAPIQTIAITEMRPLSKMVLPPGSFENVLAATLAKDECMKVIEREKFGLALKELAPTPLTDQQRAMRLGQILNSDAILGGYYSISNRQIIVSARFTDAATGEVINIFELTGSLNDPPALSRQLAQQILAAVKFSNAPADSPLLRWLPTPASSNRDNAAPAQARTLAQREQAVTELLDLLGDPTKPPPRRALAVAPLCEICGEAFLPQVLALTTAYAPELRVAAVNRLARLGDRAHRPLLEKMLLDQDLTVQYAVVEALVRIAGLDAKSELADALNDFASRIRGHVVLELVKAGDRSLIPLLLALDPARSYLKDDDALIALCRADDPSALGELRSRFDSANAAANPIAAAWLLATRWPESRFAVLVQQAFQRAPNLQARARLAAALAVMGNPSSIPILIQALPSPAAQTASPETTALVTAIVRALEDLTGQSLGPDPERWQQWLQTNSKSAKLN